MSEVVCACCGKQRNELRVQKSKLLEGAKFAVCSTCKARGFEPRYLIVLVARSEGIDAVADYIRNGKYEEHETRPILGHEIIV